MTGQEKLAEYDMTGQEKLAEYDAITEAARKIAAENAEHAKADRYMSVGWHPMWDTRGR